MGGSAIESVVECAASGAEFVALGLAVVSCTDGPREAVRKANELLDQHAPLFETD
jgi:thiamine monophosphate synthase